MRTSEEGGRRTQGRRVVVTLVCSAAVAAGLMGAVRPVALAQEVPGAPEASAATDACQAASQEEPQAGVPAAQDEVAPDATSEPLALGEEGAADANAEGFEAGLEQGDPVSVASPIGMGFVYVDKATVASGETQTIAMVLDGDVTVTAANLTYLDGQGTEHAVGASALAGNAALFELPADVEGTYRLAGMEYNALGEDGAAAPYTYVVDLSGDGAGACTFGVSGGGAAGSGAAGGTDAFYAVDADGNEQGYASLGEALTSAAADVPATQLVNGKFVIALDPGHGADDSGACGWGLAEKDLTWAITMYCKQALEEYPGVQVVLTRGEDECPSIRDRAQRAYDAGANVVVSIHINSADKESANGAEVWYPNDSSWKYDETHVPAETLSQNILDKLVALGLTDRGIKVRMLYDEMPYPDGSDSDYYGIIRYSRQLGIAGIIVEHAFVSNESDAGLLASDEALRAMGRADAEGIAQTYGLGKERTALYGDAIPGQWYVDEGWVSYVTEHDLMTGVKDADGIARNFCPEESLTRGQLATILYRAANPGATDTTAPDDYALDDGFSDSPRDAQGNLVPAYFNAAVKWCSDNGIVTGYTDGPNKGKFLADDPVTREDLAVMAYRFARYMGVDVSDVRTDNFDDASDHDDVQGYACDAVVWCASEGVMTGYRHGDGVPPTLEPQGTAIRGAAAKVITVLFRDVLGQG